MNNDATGTGYTGVVAVSTLIAAVFVLVHVLRFVGFGLRDGTKFMVRGGACGTLALLALRAHALPWCPCCCCSSIGRACVRAALRLTAACAWPAGGDVRRALDGLL